MFYVIGDGESYLNISGNECAVVDNIDTATKWEKAKDANKAHQNLIKTLRQAGFQVRRIEDGIVASQIEEVELGFDILEKADEILELAKRAEKRAAYLNEQIRQVDLSIVDIEHAAEFYNLNAAQGYELYKMLHDARIRRRKLKNEMDKIHYFLGSKTSSGGMENLKKSIAGLDNRKYRPRVINELFGV